MPADNYIVRHWQTELQVFHKNFLLLQEQLNTEAIHDLRVAVKKLRSYYKLYADLSKKKDIKKLFTKTGKLFSVLGKYRNIEVSTQLLVVFSNRNKLILNPLLIYLQLLQDQISEYCRQALQQFEEVELGELTSRLEKDLENFSAEEISDKVKDIIALSIEDIKSDLKHFKNKSHLIRKHLKDIFYWSKIFPDELVFTKSQLKSIDKILNHLGSVQDHEVLIANLKNFRKTILSGRQAEYELIKKIETRAIKKKDSLLVKANRMTEELIVHYKKNDPIKDRLSAPHRNTVEPRP